MNFSTKHQSVVRFTCMFVIGTIITSTQVLVISILNLLVKLMQRVFLIPIVHASEAVVQRCLVKKVFLSGISKSKLLQVSFDGPDVNLSFLDLLEEDRNEKELSQLVHIGTCGLHTLHNSMKHNSTNNSLSHHPAELIMIMRHLHKQYLQPSHYSSVHIVGSKARE